MIDTEKCFKQKLYSSTRDLKRCYQDNMVVSRVSSIFLKKGKKKGVKYRRNLTLYIFFTIYC